MKINVQKDCAEIKAVLNSDDVIIKKFRADDYNIALVYLDSMSDKQLLEDGIVRRLTVIDKITPPLLEFLTNNLAYTEEIKEIFDKNEAAVAIADGDIILLMEGAESFFMISLRKYQMRNISEPPTSAVLHGPREGFIEDMKVNVTLLRRRLRNPALRIKTYKVGRYSATPVTLVYIEGVADPKVVSAITERLNSIDIDGIIDSSYIMRFLEKRQYSIFEQIGNTEKADIAAAKILEGRVGIVVDGSPLVLTIPFLIIEHFQDSYDYYTNASRASLLRWIRLLGAFFTIVLPAMYVAMQEFHYHLLPLKFLITIQNSIANIPFTPPLEMVVVLLLFEVLHQASIRMPKYVGVTLSIVGAIVLGETAVNAGLISSPSVLIIALSAIGINCIPDDIGTFSTLRVMNLLIACVLGLFGMIVFWVFTATYLSTMDSYGTPYLAPFSPYIAEDMKDTVFKASIVEMEKRPKSLHGDNPTRLRRKR